MYFVVCVCLSYYIYIKQTPIYNWQKAKKFHLFSKYIFGHISLLQYKSAVSDSNKLDLEPPCTYFSFCFIIALIFTDKIFL